MKKTFFALFIFVQLSTACHAGETEMFGVFSSFQQATTAGLEIHVLPDPAIIIKGPKSQASEPEFIKVKLFGNNLLFKIAEKSSSGLPPGYYEATISKDKMVLVGPGLKRELPKIKSYR